MSFAYTTIYQNDTINNPDMNLSEFGKLIIVYLNHIHNKTGQFPFMLDLLFTPLNLNSNDKVFYQYNTKSHKKRLCVISDTNYDLNMFIIKGNNITECDYVKQLSEDNIKIIKSKVCDKDYILQKIKDEQALLQLEQATLETKLSEIKEKLRKLSQKRMKYDKWYYLQQRYSIKYDIVKIQEFLDNNNFQRIGVIGHGHMSNGCQTEFYTYNGSIYQIDTSPYDCYVTEKTIGKFMKGSKIFTSIQEFIETKK